MSALLALLLAASDPTPLPSMEAPPRTGEVAGAPEDIAPQVSFGVFSMVNGVWVGLNTCALLGCFDLSSGVAFLGGAIGAGAGVGVAYLSSGLTREWGRAALLDSGIAASAIGAGWLASRHFLHITDNYRYRIAVGLDVVGTAGMLVLAPRVAPRPEAVWLVDSLALWGAFVGSLLIGFIPAPEDDPVNLVLLGASGGGLVGAMLAASASRMSAARFWAANGAALLGGLVLGGGLFIVEQLRTRETRAFNPAIPAAGAAAGIAGGFLAGFALSESF